MYRYKNDIIEELEGSLNGFLNKFGYNDDDINKFILFRTGAYGEEMQIYKNIIQTHRGEAVLTEKSIEWLKARLHSLEISIPSRWEAELIRIVTEKMGEESLRQRQIYSDNSIAIIKKLLNYETINSLSEHKDK